MRISGRTRFGYCSGNSRAARQPESLHKIEAKKTSTDGSKTVTGLQDSGKEPSKKLGRQYEPDLQIQKNLEMPVT